MRGVQADRELIKCIERQGLRKIHAIILEELWSREWVESKRLLAVTNQAEYARRIRELRDEYGFDIVPKKIKGIQNYRLESRKPRFQGRKRQYLTATEKKKVILRDGITCAICGYEPSNGKANGNLQYDHKIPFKERMGETSVDNTQILCVQCNVIKRRACQKCNTEDCTGCPYAYPEQVETIHIVSLSKDSSKKLYNLAEESETTVSKIIEEIISKMPDHRER